jgi:hypothetical protein
MRNPNNSLLILLRATVAHLIRSGERNSGPQQLRDLKVLMDSIAIEKAIKDCGLPGRLVEVEKNLVTVDLLNDRTERLERVQLGVSEFCDLLLDWRQKLISRAELQDSIVQLAMPTGQVDREAEPSSV